MMRHTESEIVDPGETTADEEGSEADFLLLDNTLYCGDYNYFASNLEYAKNECLRLIDASPNGEYWSELFDVITEEAFQNNEASWDQILGEIYPLIYDVLAERYNEIAFYRDNEVKIAEFIHRYAIYSFLESSEDTAERSDRFENLLGTTQHIFLSGHKTAEALNDRRAITEYQTGYESFLSILTSCKDGDELKNSVLALLEVSPSVDWESEKERPTILGAMAQHTMDKGDYLYDGESQRQNAFIEAVAIGLNELCNREIAFSEEEFAKVVEIAISSAEKSYLVYLAEIASNHPDTAMKVLLPILQDQNNHEVQRHIALSLLYRIELGKIGISEEGIEYLSKRFDLGELNNPAYSVYRLTADGKLGVFDDQDKLMGFVQMELSDFESEKETVSKKFREITIDILFTPQADETDDDRRQKQSLVDEFKENYLNTYAKIFTDEKGNIPFHMNNLSLAEQGFVLKFLNSQDEDNPMRQNFFGFVDRYGEDGLRALRSIEFDPAAGERLLDLDEQMPRQEIKELFRLYGSLYATAQDVAEWIKKALLADTANPTSKDLIEVNIIREQILRLANEALLYPEPSADGKISASPFGLNLQGLPGDQRLYAMNRELKQLIALNPTPESFMNCRFIFGRYLADNVPSGDHLSLSEQVISNGLASLYNNREFSLRDYEGKTSDTSQSLTALLRSIDEMPSQDMTGDPSERLIYDIGSGDGRIAIPLALSGAKVVGIDYSERMVGDSKTRPIEFQQSVRNNPDDHLVTSVERAFGATGREVTDDAVAQLPEKIDIHYGNFFDFDSSEFRDNFGERQPDVTIIMWHTLGFAGDVDRMKQVLKNAYDILRPGGRIIIEMPDRNFGGYARAIREFHEAHKDLPFGTIKDAPSSKGDSPTEQNEELATWRYFPKNSEIESALESVGFDTTDGLSQSYFVQAEANSTAKLLIKENLFVADKPLDSARQASITASSQKGFGYIKASDRKRIEKIREEIEAA